MTIEFGPLASTDLISLATALPRGAISIQRCQRGHDVRRGHLLAVVELDARAQRDRIHKTVLGDRGHALGEHWDYVRVGIVGVKQLVNVLHDRADQVGGGRHRIERLRFADHCQIRGTAFRWSGRHRRARKGSRKHGSADQARDGGTANGGKYGMLCSVANHDASFAAMGPNGPSVSDRAPVHRDTVRPPRCNLITCRKKCTPAPCCVKSLPVERFVIGEATPAASFIPAGSPRRAGAGRR